MPLPNTARFARQNEEGAYTEFDSPSMVVDVYRQMPKLDRKCGAMAPLHLRMTSTGLARLTWLADEVGVAKSTLARELLEAAIVQGLDSMNILEESKAEVEAEIAAIGREIEGGSA